MVTGIRRLVTRDAAGAAHRAARRVEFSDQAAALEALAQIHRVATDARLPRPASAQSASVANFVGAPFAASLLDKPSGAPAHLRSDPWPAAAQARVAAHKAARSF